MEHWIWPKVLLSDFNQNQRWGLIEDRRRQGVTLNLTRFSEPDHRRCLFPMILKHDSIERKHRINSIESEYLSHYSRKSFDTEISVLNGGRDSLSGLELGQIIRVVRVLC